MTFNATPPTQTYTYDQENRLTGAAGYAYTYDGDGNRVRKSSGSTGTLYWYMTPGIVGESDLSGNLTDEYVFFDGERVARKSTNGVFYYFSDHLKTASVITDSARQHQERIRFLSLGRRASVRQQRFQPLQVHRQRTRCRNATRLLRREVLLEWAGTVGLSRLESDADPGAVCEFRGSAEPESVQIRAEYTNHAYRCGWACNGWRFRGVVRQTTVQVRGDQTRHSRYDGK